MSRFKEWTGAENGLGRFAEKHIELDFRGAGRPNKYYGVELPKLINEFSKMMKLKGSYTNRVLLISKSNYAKWCDFIINKNHKELVG